MKARIRQATAWVGLLLGCSSGDSFLHTCAELHPAVCALEYRPVCGVSVWGVSVRTYANPCQACASDVSFMRLGACDGSARGGV